MSSWDSMKSFTPSWMLLYFSPSEPITSTIDFRVLAHCFKACWVSFHSSGVSGRITSLQRSTSNGFKRDCNCNKDKKRDMPAILKTTLSMDAYLSHALVNLLEKSLPLKQLKVHYQVLEVSCHGIAWIASLLAFIWILNNRSMYQMQVNLLLGLVIDIIFVSLLKAITRRRRPAANNDPFCIGPDKYSFPSGHASRAAFVVYFFLNLSPLSLIFVPPLLAWSTSVCLSRLMMRRHHLLDIAAGVLLGIFEGILIGCMYLDVPTCAYLISWMTDEKIDGAEYDV